MRDYAKLGPTFWTGTTGKALRRRGSEGVVVALYLVSSPHSNMLGLYYQPRMYMAHETGLGIEGASKGLQDCIDCGFCLYDDDTEMVFVPEMAAWQIADELKATDKRCPGIQKDYDALPNCPFLGAWFDRYAQAFHLRRRREFEAPEPQQKQAPSKPHRSQEQEQEQEQELGRREAPSPRPAKKCPATFEVTAEMRDWAKSEASGISVDRETSKFRDHTFNRAITDWPGAWRNWLRRAKEDLQQRVGGRGAPASTDELFGEGVR